MSDTVSARAGWGPGDTELTFVTPSRLATQPAGVGEGGKFHVSGGNQTSAAEPGLFVQFTTITPDFAGLLPGIMPQIAEVGTVAYAVTTPSGPLSVIVEFETRDAGIRLV